MLAAPIQADGSASALLDAAGLNPKFRSSNDPRVVAVPIVCTSTEDAEQRLRDEFVPANRPVLLRSALAAWPPVQRWGDDEYLRNAAPEARISARRIDDRGVSISGAAYESEEMSWPTLIDSLAKAAQAGSSSAAPHYAAQVRLRTALPNLFADTRPELGLLRAFGAVWRNAPSGYFGCGAQTPLHFDLLENLFCVATGTKHVALWHPADGGLLYPGSGGEAAFSVADVYAPDLEAFPLLRDAEARALHVEVHAGDALYIPC